VLVSTVELYHPIQTLKIAEFSYIDTLFASLFSGARVMKHNRAPLSRGRSALSSRPSLSRRPARTQHRQAPPQQRNANNHAPATVEPFTWEELPAIIEQLQLGKATTVKMTVIGRPGQIVEKPGFIILGMTYDKQPSLPKGLPDFPAQSTKCMVLIAAKQWAKVASALDNPEDALIIEGTPAHDHRFHGVILYATNVTTKLQQQAKRANQSAVPA
jgi:hypothetical protein